MPKTGPTPHPDKEHILEVELPKFWNGEKSLQDIANEFGVSHGTIKSWSSREKNRRRQQVLEREIAATLDNTEVLETSRDNNNNKSFHIKSLGLSHSVSKNIEQVLEQVAELQSKVKGKVLRSSRSLDAAHDSIDAQLARTDLTPKDLDGLLRALKAVIEMNAKLHLLPYGEIKPPSPDSGSTGVNINVTSTPGTSSKPAVLDHPTEPNERETLIKKGHQEGL